jgi:hypothetical protein
MQFRDAHHDWAHREMPFPQAGNDQGREKSLRLARGDMTHKFQTEQALYA